MAVFNWLLEATLLGSVLILFMLLARRFLRRQVGSRMILFCWLLVALRLLLPVALPNPAMNELRPTLSEDAIARPVADQIRVRTHDLLFDYGQPLWDEEEPYTLPNLAFDLACYSSYGWTGKWLLIGYLAVATSLLLVFLALNLRFSHRLRRSRIDTLSPEDQKVYEELCRRYRVRPVPVWYVDPLGTPCVFGFFRPFIALPLTLRPDELSPVLAHEICHLKSRDTRFALLRLLCVAAHWFNPLVWLGAHLSRLDTEMACDVRVISGMNEQERLDYAKTLVLSVSRRNAPSLSVLASGMSMNGRQMKMRLRRIVDSKKVRRQTCILFLILAMSATFMTFGTAESHSSDYDLALDKAQYGYLMDEPYSASLPDDGYEPLQRSPVTTEGQALGYAYDILTVGGLLPYVGAWPQIQHENQVWTAAGTNPENGRAWVLCFSDEGIILGFNTHLDTLKRASYPFEPELYIVYRLALMWHS